jgi:hypothetical protein
MTQDRTTRTMVAPSVLSPVIALLALAVLLLGVFAMHSEATGHDMHGSMSASVSQQANETVGTAVGMTSLALVGTAVATLTSITTDGLLDCALLAMACVLLLTVVAAVVLPRRPATYRRLLDAGGAALGVTRRTVTRPVHRPSLTLLSISRV